MHCFKDNNIQYFLWMQQTTFEETRISASELGDKTKWLKENMECMVLMWNDKVSKIRVIKELLCILQGILHNYWAIMYFNLWLFVLLILFGLFSLMLSFSGRIESCHACLQVIDVELPITVVVKVTQTDPGLKGDTAQGTFSSPLLPAVYWFLFLSSS